MANINIESSSPNLSSIVKNVIDTMALVNQLVHEIQEAPNDLLFKGKNSTEVQGTVPIPDAYPPTKIIIDVTKILKFCLAKPIVDNNKPEVIIQMVYNKMDLLPNESTCFNATNVNIKLVNATMMAGNNGSLILSNL